MDKTKDQIWRAEYKVCIINNKVMELLRNKTPLTLADMQKILIQATLEFHNGNKTAAAKTLKMNRGTLRTKVEEYGIK